MEKNAFHVMIKPEKGTKLKFSKQEAKISDRLPAHLGTIFKSKEEIKEEIKSFKDFIS
jgi:hypothetical protein